MACKRALQADKIARRVEAQGVRVKRTKNGYTAYANDGQTTVGWHRTSSDHRWLKNLTADLRRIGVQI